MKVTGKTALNLLLDSYLLERLNSFSTYMDMTKTQALTVILDQFFGTLDETATDSEMIEFFNDRDRAFVQEHPEYTKTQYMKLKQLSAGGNGKLYQYLKKGDRTPE